jgi:hypothetical protein
LYSHVYTKSKFSFLKNVGLLRDSYEWQ